MLGETVLRENLLSAASPSSGARRENQGSLRDVQILRNFLGGNAVFAFFDVPWMPIYFILIFILHPMLGMVAVAGGILVFILGFATERLTRKRLENATRLNAHASAFTGAAARNASIVRSMGMVGNISARWRRLNDVVIRLQTRASRSAGLIHAVSKALRVGLQVANLCRGRVSDGNARIHRRGDDSRIHRHGTGAGAHRSGHGHLQAVAGGPRGIQAP